jgi:hypothetical protein
MPKKASVRFPLFPFFYDFFRVKNTGKKTNVFSAFSDDCLPPEGFFESQQALFESINEYAKARGYAFTIKRSKRDNGLLKVFYACDRSRRLPSSPSRERRRNTTTRMTECPFSVIAKESREGWYLKHRSDGYTIHNHEPSLHASAHPVHRQLDTSQVKILSNAGLPPKEIQTLVREGGSLATRQDIYNRIAEARRESREGESPIHALSNQLEKEGFWSRIQFGADRHVTAVLFAHPESLVYLRAYPEVLLLDCTYKTNKYGMPLLDMIGVDATGRSFCIAFAFLSGESEEDYLWALERLKSLYEQCGGVFPSVILTDRCLAVINAASTLFPSATSICIWHANKAVLARCRPAFATNEEWAEFYSYWFIILNSSTEETYEENLRVFESKYTSTNWLEVGYIKETWLPYKEKLVSAWVDRRAHFGNTVTSRAEGIHGLLKSYLKISVLDLFEASKAIRLALNNQLSELKSNQAKQQIRTPIELDKALYRAVQGWVSHEALREVEKQRKKQWKTDPPPSPTCTGTFTRVYGLPCVHILTRRTAPLQLEEFHTHWYLIRDRSPVYLLEPHRIESKVQRSCTIPESSTQREPSLFEVVEVQVEAQTRRPPVCSDCHNTGHRRNARVCPQRYR